MIANSQSVPTTIRFTVPPKDGEELWQNIISEADGSFKTNVSSEDIDTYVENVRGREEEFSVDTNGFQLVGNSPSKHTEFTDDEAIEREYYPEVIDNIKKTTGASRVVIFDHTVRRRRPDIKENTPQNRQPVAFAHVDQTPKSAAARVRRHLPESDVPKLLDNRYQVINLWRPIKHAALDHPLAMADFQSVDPAKNVVPLALVYPDMRGETYAIMYGPNLKFKYFKGMTPDEFVLIKCFDSVLDGSVAMYTPHTAFIDPTTPEDAPFRESIEVRALVFYD